MNSLISVLDIKDSKPVLRHKKPFGLFSSVLIAGIPLLFSQLSGDHSEICPKDNYLLYSGLNIFGPAFCVLVIMVTLTIDYWKQKRKYRSLREMVRPISIRLFLTLIITGITIGSSLQYSKYYACLSLGPVKGSEDNSFMRAYEEAFISLKSKSRIIGWLIVIGCLISLLLFIFLYYWMFHETQEEAALRKFNKYKRMETQRLLKEALKKMSEMISKNRYDKYFDKRLNNFDYKIESVMDLVFCFIDGEKKFEKIDWQIIHSHGKGFEEPLSLEDD